MAAQMSMPGICSKEPSRRKFWSRYTSRPSPGIRTSISVIRYVTWEGPRSSSSSIPRGPLVTSRAPIRHHPLPHLAAVRQWTLAPQIRAPNLVGGGYSAIIVRGSVISHASAHSRADPSNNSKPGPHSNKEAIPTTRELMLCVGCPLQKCGTFSRI